MIHYFFSFDIEPYTNNSLVSVAFKTLKSKVNSLQWCLVNLFPSSLKQLESILFYNNNVSNNNVNNVVNLQRINHWNLQFPLSFKELYSELQLIAVFTVLKNTISN